MGSAGVFGAGCSLSLDSLDAAFRDEAPSHDAAVGPAEAGIDAAPPPGPVSLCADAAGVGSVASYRLAAPEPAPFGWFGQAGAITADRLVVAAPAVSFQPTVGSIFSGSSASMPPAVSAVDAFSPEPGDGVLSAFQLPYFNSTGASSGAYSVAMDGDMMVVGVAAADANGARDSGEVFVFEHADDAWALRERLTAPTGQGCALFGRSIALAGGVLAVGAPGTTTDGSSSCDRVADAASGQVHVFRHDGERFVAEQTLVPPRPASGAFFGESVDLDAGRLVVGAPFTIPMDREDAASPRRGAAYVFRAEDRGWPLEATLDNAGATQDSAFGASVRIDGELLVVGAPLDDRCGGDEPIGIGGRVYVFRLSNGSWRSDQCLRGAPNGTPDLFGWSLGLSASHLIVGAPFESSGAGAAYAFGRSPNGLDCLVRLEAPLRESAPFSSDEIFGAWVRASDRWWAVGAPRATVDGAFEGGAVFMFEPPSGP